MLIRPLVATDEPALSEAFARLSDESRRLRFGYVPEALNATAMGQLIHSVDGRDHVAFVAIQENSPHRLVGVGRILRYPHDPQTLDVGITVADEYQDDGLGRALVDRLALHRPRPADRIVTQVTPGNHRINALLAVFGRPTASGDAGELEIELDDQASPPGPCTGTHRGGPS